MATIPVWLLFLSVAAGTSCAIEAGYRLGVIAHRQSKEEKESPVAAVSSTTLGLLAFILAFTFAIVTDRYDAKRRLVGEEANALRTVYLRSEFLPETDRERAATLLRRYVDLKITGAKELVEGDAALEERRIAWLRIERQLWDMAVANARQDMNSDVAALYVESLNDLVDAEAMRVATAWHARIPGVIWSVFFVITALAMLGFGYHMAIAGSRRTKTAFILILSFSLMIALIADLDRPQSGFLSVSQRPLIELQMLMEREAEARQQ
jgi:hypothetical protein